MLVVKRESEIFWVRCSILKDLLKNWRKQQNPKCKFGGVAQLGEHLPCKQGVMGSNPIISTTGCGTRAEKDETAEIL